LSELERDSDALGYVNSVLLLALKQIGEHVVDLDCLNGLCMADRQFLMLRLAALLNGEQVWLKVTCGQCQAPFDIDLRRCDLPVKEAGPGFPAVRLSIPTGELELRVPNARIQAEILALSDQEALDYLLRHSITKVNGAAPDEALIHGLGPEEIALIDQALDEFAPAVCSELLVTCPECATEQRATLNHYQVAGLSAAEILIEIHTLAIHYHWGEEEILKLPRARRHRYLALIDSANRMIGQVH